MLVVDEVGTQLGELATDTAIEMAVERGLDLVEVAPDYDLTNSTSTLAAQLLMNTIGRILNQKKI